MPRRAAHENNSGGRPSTRCRQSLLAHRHITSISSRLKPYGSVRLAAVAPGGCSASCAAARIAAAALASVRMILARPALAGPMPLLSGLMQRKRRSLPVPIVIGRRSSRNNLARFMHCRSCARRGGAVLVVGRGTRAEKAPHVRFISSVHWRIRPPAAIRELGQLVAVEPLLDSPLL